MQPQRSPEAQNETLLEGEGKRKEYAATGARRAPERLAGGRAGGDNETDEEADEEEVDDDDLFCERVVVIRGSELAVNAAESTLRRIVGRQPILTRETMTVPQVLHSVGLMGFQFKMFIYFDSNLVHIKMGLEHERINDNLFLIINPNP